MTFGTRQYQDVYPGGDIVDIDSDIWVKERIPTWDSLVLHLREMTLPHC